MKILFKIIAVPFMLALTIIVPVLTFLFCYAATFLRCFRAWRSNQRCPAVHRRKTWRLCVPDTVVSHFALRYPRHSGMAD